MESIKKFSSSENIFLVIALIFGTLFVVYTPKFQVPDEITHYARAIQVSEGLLYPAKNVNGAGVVLDKEVLNFMYGMSNIPANLKPVDMSRDRVFVNLPIVQSPFMYIPQVLGILIGKFLSLSQGTILILAREVNLIFWALLGYLAIKFTPIGKWFFCGVLLLPMTVFMAASVSPDGFLIGLSALLIGGFLRSSDNKDKLGKNSLLIIAGGVFMALLKFPYFIIIYIFILLPKYKFRSKRDHLVFLACLAMLPLAVAALWQGATRALAGLGSSTMFDANRIIDTTAQFKYILENPFQYFKTFVRTYILLGDFYQESFIGILGPLTVRLNSWILTGYTFLLSLSLLASDEKDNPIKGTNKFLVLMLVVFLLVLIPTLLYLIWTPVGKSIIEGVQGRYFLPVALLLPIIFSGLLYKKIELKNAYFKILFSGSTIIMLALALHRLISSY